LFPIDAGWSNFEKFYIGGEGTSGVFTWINSGTRIDAVFNDWDNGQPSSASPAYGGETCLFFYQFSGNKKWFDFTCDTPGGYVCELPVTRLP
jgi:hypothetical protein